MGETLKRQKRKLHGFKKKAGWNDEHHIKAPCSRGGEKIKSNLLLIDVYRHDAWHLLFCNQTLKEIITLLQKYPDLKRFLFTIDNYYKHDAFHLLFGDKSLNQVIIFLKRIQSIKDSQQIYLRLTA